MRRIAIAAALLLCGSARADPTVLRFATVAPDGTGYARELRAFAQDVFAGTDGKVQVKWYFGGIAGDESEVDGRVRRGQIDGVASGGPLCSHHSPSLAIFASPGIFVSSDEAAFVRGRIKPRLDKEFAQNGYVNLNESGMGALLVWSRRPINTMADLAKQRIFVWTDEQPLLRQWHGIGMKTASLPIALASKSYVSGQIDGFIAPPSAALAFQWSTQTPFVSDLRIGYLNGCLVVATRTFDALPHESQLAIRGAAAKLGVRFEDAGRTMDDALMGGLLVRQGVHVIPASPSLRADFFEASRAMREQIGREVIAPDLLAEVQTLLADYRAEHARGR